MENVNSGIKDVILVTKSVKEDVKDIKMGIHESVKEGVKEVAESMKEDVKDMKKDIKEYVKEGVKEALNEMKNTEQAEMEEDHVIMSMENIEKDDFPNPRLSALGELYLRGFIFALNMKLPP